MNLRINLIRKLSTDQVDRYVLLGSTWSVGSMRINLIRMLILDPGQWIVQADQLDPYVHTWSVAINCTSGSTWSAWNAVHQNAPNTAYLVCCRWWPLQHRTPSVPPPSPSPSPSPKRTKRGKHYAPETQRNERMRKWQHCAIFKHRWHCLRWYCSPTRQMERKSSRDILGIS